MRGGVACGTRAAELLGNTNPFLPLYAALRPVYAALRVRARWAALLACPPSRPVWLWRRLAATTARCCFSLLQRERATICALKGCRFASPLGLVIEHVFAFAAEGLPY